jgi:hypothetical protein
VYQLPQGELVGLVAQEGLRSWDRKTLAPSITTELRKNMEADPQPRHLLTEPGIHRRISEEA